MLIDMIQSGIIVTLQISSRQKKMKGMIWMMMVLGMVSMGQSFKLELVQDSNGDENKVEVPELNVHRFSCQLVVFVVVGNNFVMRLKDVDEKYFSKEVKVVLFQNDSDFYKMEYFNMVESKTVNMSIQLKRIGEGNDNIEKIAVFNFTFDNKNFQIRKAYLLIQNPEDQQEQYKITLPIGAILLTQLFGLILTLVLPWNVRYHKYLPFKFNLWASAAYVLILVITLFSYLFFSKISESAELIKDFQVYFLAFFGFTCMLIYMQDLLFVCIAKNSTSYLISFIITVIVIICDYVIPQTRDAWFINDIIAVMIAGVVIKFVIIYKLKGSIAGLIVVWIFCIFRECLQFMSFLKFDQGFGVRLYPLFLQIPNFFNSHSTITCSAYGSSKVLRCFIQIIAIGVIINYCIRVDISLETYIYRGVMSIVALISVVLELILNVTCLKELPALEVGCVIIFYPLSMITLYCLSRHRSEWLEVWDGNFYDAAINRALIKRTVNFIDLQSGLGKNLYIKQKDSTEQIKELH